MNKFITKYIVLICLLCCIADHSAYENDGNPVHNFFGSLRRHDYKDKPTYHFHRVSKYEPVIEPIFYVEGYGGTSKIIVGFNNMLIFGELKEDHHFVIYVNEDLNEDSNIPSYFLDSTDSGELFEVITLKPTTTTTTTTAFPRFADRVKEWQREALSDFDPDTQSFSEYLMQVSLNTSRLVKNVEQ